MSNPIILFHTERFNFEKAKNDDGKDTVIISGDAQPLDDDSRNGVRYRPESVKKAADSLKGVAFLFNHDSARSLGHVVDAGLSKTHLTYSADVDPEEKEYIRKVERGDIKHVSVGCMVENVEFNEEENIYICDVKEYVELSAVTVPGFSNTSANKEGAIYLANALGDKKALENLKAAAKENEDDPEADARKKPVEDKEDSETDSANAEANDDDEDDDKDKDDEDEEEKNDDEGDDEDDSEEANDDEDDAEEKDDEDEDEEEAKDDDEDDDEDDDKEENLGKPFAEMNHEELVAECKKLNVTHAEDASSEEMIKAIEEQIPEVEEAEADDETTEEKVAKMSAQMKELFSKNEDLENRLSIAEAKIDAMNDSDEDTEADTPEETPNEKKEELNPDETEEFKDEHDDQTRTKENLASKEKALLGKETKKVSEDRKVIKMNDVLLKNKSY